MWSIESTRYIYVVIKHFKIKMLKTQKLFFLLYPYFFWGDIVQANTLFDPLL